MFGSIGKLICAALAVMCFGYAGVCLFTNTDKQANAIIEVADCNVHPENEGKIVMLRGKLNYGNSITEDPELGVRVKTPVLVRTVEMYQNVPSNSSNEKTRIRNYAWDSRHHPGFTDKYNRHHSNPNMPEGVPKADTFAAALTVGNGNLKVDAAFTKVLSYGKYVTFKDTYTSLMKNVTRLPSKKLPAGFVNKGDQYYRSYNGTNSNAPRVGDVRISYQALKWSEDLPEFTIIGLQKDGKVLKEKDSFFYDYRIEDRAQLQREVRSSNRSAMFGAIVCGAILAAIALFI